MKFGKVFKRIFLVLFIGAISFTVYNQEVLMSNIRNNISLQQAEFSKVQAENEKLTNLVDSTNSEDYTIRNARTRLGLLRPGEIPVIDTSGN